jgi:hypothetical protein
MARMTQAQKEEMRARRTERDTSALRQVAGAGTAFESMASYPPMYHYLPPPPPGYPPPVVHMSPPPQQIAGVNQNRQHGALQGPRGQPPGPASGSGSYGGSVAPYGYPPYY